MILFLFFIPSQYPLILSLTLKEKREREAAQQFFLLMGCFLFLMGHVVILRNNVCSPRLFSYAQPRFFLFCFNFLSICDVFSTTFCLFVFSFPLHLPSVMRDKIRFYFMWERTEAISVERRASENKWGWGRIDVKWARTGPSFLPILQNWRVLFSFFFFDLLVFLYLFDIRTPDCADFIVAFQILLQYTAGHV